MKLPDSREKEKKIEEKKIEEKIKKVQERKQDSGERQA